MGGVAIGEDEMFVFLCRDANGFEGLPGAVAQEVNFDAEGNRSFRIVS